ncbi:MAG: NUDIX domain-containing protein [Flavobacteriia bacterium]|nr:NUDIX domain-containing protein [Flavobacteriia bacterium]
MTFIEEKNYIKIMQTIPVVCVDAIITNSKGQYLLVKRANEPLKGKFWMPGGRLHKGESSEQGILRKVKEELGVDATIIKCLGHIEEYFDKVEQIKNCTFHAISIVYLLEVNSEDIKLDSQSEEWKWFDKLPNLISRYNLL